MTRKAAKVSSAYEKEIERVLEGYRAAEDGPPLPLPRFAICPFCGAQLCVDLFEEDPDKCQR